MNIQGIELAKLEEGLWGYSEKKNEIPCEAYTNL